MRSFRPDDEDTPREPVWRRYLRFRGDDVGAPRSGMLPVAAGAAAGLLLALATGRLIESLLYGTSPYDPLLLASVVAVLLAVSAIAMLGPALRARRLDPATVLRSE